MNDQRQPSTNYGSEQSDLFAPSLQQQTQPNPQQPRPWRVSSQFWVAFFGGILAYTAIAYINSGRLGIDARRRRLFVAIAIGGLILSVVFGYVLLATNVYPPERTTQAIRLASRLAAVLCFAAGYQIQNSADRRYAMNYGETYSSLWKPGFLTVFGLGIVQAVLNLLLFWSLLPL